MHSKIIVLYQINTIDVLYQKLSNSDYFYIINLKYKHYMKLKYYNNTALFKKLVLSYFYIICIFIIFIDNDNTIHLFVVFIKNLIYILDL